MDYSQYIRLKQEAANQYLARSKTVDSSLLTFQRQAKAAYGGSNASGNLNVPIIPAPLPDMSGSCPAAHTYTQGYVSQAPLTKELQVARAAGAAICGGPDYSVISPGIQLLNCSTITTILTSYNNNTPAPGQWPAYGYGQNTYFPRQDTPTSTCLNCGPNKYPYSSG